MRYDKLFHIIEKIGLDLKNRRVIHKLRIQCLGHILREENNPLRIALEWKPQGKQPRKGLRKRWIVDLNAMDIEDLQKIVCNREKWRDIVVMAKTLTEKYGQKKKTLYITNLYYILFFNINFVNFLQVVGWGRMENEELSPVLLEKELQMFNLDECLNKYPYHFKKYLTTDKICADDPLGNKYFK